MNDYDAISEKAAKYHREGYNGILESIPVKFGDDHNTAYVSLKLVPDHKDEQLMEWARQATLSLFKGIYTKGYTNGKGGGILIAPGFQTNATSVTKLNGIDSNLDAADVYKALTKFVGSIRGVGEISLLMDPLFFKMACGVLGQFKVKNVYISQDLALVGGTDIPGTHSRLMGWVNNSSILERVYSRGFGLAVELGDFQIYTVRLVGCVHDPRGVIFSEQISWRR
jgi:hypothetical protein